MKSLLTFLAVICALAALGLGGLAWQQRQELASLRATALAGDDRAALQKRLWEAEKRARDLEARVLAAENARSSVRSDEGKTKETPAQPSPAPTKTAPSQLEIMSFLNNPDTLRLMTAKFREQVDTRYAGLFKTLNLDATQLAQLKNLLVERQSAAIDVISASMAQGMKPNQDEMRQLIGSVQAETDQKIATTLGAASYAQFQAYENAQLFRGATSSLQQGLARVSAPLSDEQAEQFTQSIATLAQNSFSAAQQQALRQLTQLQQTGQTLNQVQQLYKEQNSPPAAAGKKPGK